MHFTKTNTSIFFQNKPLKNEGPTKWDQFNVPPPPFTTESDFLKNFCLKTHIAWGNSIDERWTHKLHMCATLAETVSSCKNQFILKLLIFLDILNQKREIWLDKVDEPRCPFNLINKRTCSSISTAYQH